MQPERPSGERKIIAVYELYQYECDRVPLKECNQTFDLAEPIVISIASTETPMRMKAFNLAFQKAKALPNTPICTIHGTKMIPQIRDLTNPRSSASEENE